MQVSIAGRRMVSSTEQQHSKKKKQLRKVLKIYKKKATGKRKENRAQADALQIHTKWHPQPQRNHMQPLAKPGIAAKWLII